MPMFEFKCRLNVSGAGHASAAAPLLEVSEYVSVSPVTPSSLSLL